MKTWSILHSLSLSLVDWLIGSFCNKKEKCVLCLALFVVLFKLNIPIIEKTNYRNMFLSFPFLNQGKKKMSLIIKVSKNVSFKSILNIYFWTRSFFSTRGKRYVNNLVFVIIWQGYCDSKTAWERIKERNRMNIFLIEFYHKFLA